jgi:hypothetical protein
VLDPLKGMFNTFMAMLPNIIAAGLIGFLGYVLAKVISSLVTAVCRGLDALSAKAGLPPSFSPAKLLGQIVFIFVFVPILISALDTLKIEAISAPATEMVQSLMAAIPQILAAALILAVAYVVGKFVTTFVANLLQNLGADALPEKIGVGRLFARTTLSKFCGGLLFFFIMLAAAVSASEKLQFPQVSVVLGQLLAFAGNVVLGLVILAIGNVMANVAYDVLSRSKKNIMAPIARFAILGLVLAMGLRAMGIADDIVNLAFALVLGALAVTVALAFGIGGREAAGKQMEYWLEKLRRPE